MVVLTLIILVSTSFSCWNIRFTVAKLPKCAYKTEIINKHAKVVFLLYFSSYFVSLSLSLSHYCMLFWLMFVYHCVCSSKRKWINIICFIVCFPEEFGFPIYTSHHQFLKLFTAVHLFLEYISVGISWIFFSPAIHRKMTPSFVCWYFFKLPWIPSLNMVYVLVLWYCRPSIRLV